MKIWPVATAVSRSSSSFGRPSLTIDLNRANISSTSAWRIFRSRSASSGGRSFVTLSISLSGPLATESSVTSSFRISFERS